MIFERFSLKKKLLVSFSCVAFFLCVVVGFGIYTLKDVLFNYNHVTKVNFVNSIQLGMMSSAKWKMRTVIGRYGIPGNSSATLKELNSMFKEAVNAYDTADKKYNEIDFVEGEAELYNGQNEKYKEFIKIAQHLSELANTPDIGAKDKFFEVLQGQYYALANEHQEKLQKLIGFQNASEAPKWVKRAELTSSRGIIINLIAAGLGVLFSLMIGYFISAGLSKKLGGAATDLVEGSNQVNAAAMQISSGAQSLSSTASEQAASVEETSASVQELSGMVESNVKNAESTVSLSKAAQDQAEKGAETMDQLIVAMTEILDSNKRIEGLVKVIEEIGEKTKIIDEIVFQTKLLSFNASVEAERAGEHGRGFAVVAQEVGNLAQMSGKAATEISSIVKASIKDAQEITTENKERVGKGSDFAKEAMQLMKELRSRSESVLSAANQIVNASKEQSAGLSQISKAMDSINQATQQNAANSEESAAAAEELASQMQSVDQIVGILQDAVWGKHGDSSSHLKDTNGNSEADSRQSDSKKTKSAGNVREFKPRTKQVVSEHQLKKVVGIPSHTRFNSKESGPTLVVKGGQVDADSGSEWDKL